MRKLYLLTLIALAVSVALANPGSAGVDDDSGDDDEDAIVAVVYANLEAAEDEDLDAYMATIHEDSALYENTESIMVLLFDTYDLDYEVDDLEILEITKNEAEIRLVQITRRIRGPEFDDNEATVVHTLRRSDGEWFFWESLIEDIELLD